MGKPWENGGLMGFYRENHHFEWENHGKTKEKWWLLMGFYDHITTGKLTT